MAPGYYTYKITIWTTEPLPASTLDNAYGAVNDVLEAGHDSYWDTRVLAGEAPSGAES